MSFTTVKENQAINKFLLARINPARYINDLVSGPVAGVYTYTAPVLINDIQEQGVSLTEASSASVAVGEWYQDTTTKLISVYPVSAPSSSNSLVMFFYLYYTTERARVIREDPTSTTDPFRDWEPKLISFGDLRESIENVLQGKLTISSSSIQVINDGNEIEEYLTLNDSFFQKDIDIWLCLDDVSNIKPIYKGKITDINIEDTRFRVRFEDRMSKLADPALMGDNSQYTYFNLQDYVNLNPNDNNRPIPYFFGSVTRYNTGYESVATLSTAQKVNYESLYKAVCTNYTSAIGTSVNREWGLGRVSSDGLNDFSVTPSAVLNTDPNYTRFTVSNASEFFVGDTFVHNGEYGRVYEVDRTNSYLYTTKFTSPSISFAIETNNAPTVVIYDGSNAYYLLYARDYTASVSNTNGGNKYVSITFVNNFEATVGMGTLDPSTMIVGFRLKPDTTNGKHGSVLSNILGQTNITVNSTSITNANSALSVNVNYSIPQFDETDFNSYFDYVQDILQSTLGYIFLNENFEIEYHLFDTPTSTSSHTDTEILEQSFRVNILYKDIVTKVIAYNPHYAAEEVVSLSNTPSVTKSSNKAEHLHGVNKTVRFRHVLEDMSTRLQDIVNYRSERNALYFLKTANKNIDSLLGDDIQLETSGILGGESTKDIKILSLNKSFDRTSIIATDLGNL